MRNPLPCVALLVLLALNAPSSQAASFHPIVAITSSTAATDLFPVSNLIQGAGVGFAASEPHDKTLAGFAGNWVTDAPVGFPADYIAVAGQPVLTLDLGLDVFLDEISVWGYNSTNANGVSSFSLQFATEAEGIVGFGSSIAFNPTYFPTNNDIVRQSFSFGQTVTARYVQFTAMDNFFIAPGDGSGGNTPGGDRVGLGEIALRVPIDQQIIPEPGTLLLLGSGLVILAGYGRKHRQS